MDFSFSEEQVALRKDFRGFMENEVAPAVVEAERSGVYPRALFKRLGEKGILGMWYPREQGGSGASVVDRCIVCEACREVCPRQSIDLESHYRSPAYEKSIEVFRPSVEAGTEDKA